VRYLKHFIKWVKPNDSNPVLLIIDGHSSHKSLEAVELARKSHEITLSVICLCAIFIKWVKPNDSNPVLLIIDGHSSRKSLEAVELAQKHHVTMLTIPPHTSHNRLQPLDFTFFGPLKTMYNRQMDKWMLSNPGKRVIAYELCEIFTSCR